MKEEKWKRHIENMSERERKQVGKRERDSYRYKENMYEKVREQV